MKLPEPKRGIVEPDIKKHKFESLEQLCIDKVISFYQMISQTKLVLGEREGIKIYEPIKYKSFHEVNFDNLIKLIESGKNMKDSFYELNLKYYTFFSKCTEEQRTIISDAKIKMAVISKFKPNNNK